MKNLTYKIKVWYHLLTNSIGFYPTLISILFFFMSVITILLESGGISKILIKDFPLLMISSKDTARIILSTIAGGVISLTVFSFTMVMIVFNQAATNYSPRIIPGLISRKFHQVVLGFYVGTLIYCFIIMINIDSEHFRIFVPAFAVFVGVVLGIICLILFVYFIHSISNSIQIGNILEEIFSKTKKGIEKEIEEGKDNEQSGFEDTDNWKLLKSPKSGYLQRIEKSRIFNSLEKEDCKLDVIVPFGNFVLEGTPIAKLRGNINEEKKSQILNNFIFFEEEIVEENYFLGFKQITETAVKALSPGINDPGTAIKSIDYLTELFLLKFKLKRDTIIYKKGGAKIRIQNPAVEKLLYYCYAPIRQYGKEDVILMLKLFNSFKELIPSAHPGFEEMILKQVRILTEDSDKYLNNSADREKINQLIEDINNSFSNKFKIEKLSLKT